MRTLALLLLLATALPSTALVIPHDKGEWPDTWPEELEALRERTRRSGGELGMFERGEPKRRPRAAREE